MLKDITHLSLQGANFQNQTQLPILCAFDNQNRVIGSAKASLLYGRNGAGKSTIAKSVRKIKGEEQPSIISASFRSQTAPVTLTDAEKSHIFVFDDDFVTDNVRVEQDGLGSIVMLGDQAGLADQIATATQELQAAEADRDQKKTAAEEYKSLTNEKCPKYHIEKMKDALRGDRNWAGRDKRIKDHAVNSSVSDDTYQRFINLQPEKSRDELLLDFNTKMRELEEAKKGSKIIATAVPQLPEAYRLYSTTAGNELLRKQIDHPELSEREQRLLALVQNGMGDELRATAEEFEDPELTICPKCFQPLSQGYKVNLIASIQKVLTDEVKEHQRLLKAVVIGVMEMELAPFSSLASYQTCVDQILNINQVLQVNNTLLQSKVDDPYTPIEEELSPISDMVEALSASLRALEGERLVFNRNATSTRPIIAELTRINNEIAYYDVIEEYHRYETRKAEKTTADAALQTAQNLVTEKQTTLNQLNAQLNSIHIAINVINDGLKYIFFSENRMKIQAEGNTYRLLSNGHPVKPKDVSVGERNIIGLCYFFTRILEGKNRDTAYGEEYLLVIDDPVSSYDLENKVGILSYLKYELGKFMLGNADTRALVMTHDLLTFFDVEKIYKEINDECKQAFHDNSIKYSVIELKDRQISVFQFNKRNEYSVLLDMIYQYGNGQATEYDIVIGNVMRQALEAFSTFEYREKIENIGRNGKVVEALRNVDPAYSVYFENLMYRLVLHGGSHRAVETRTMALNFFSVISEPDKRRTAREILCFMYLLNGSHVKAHLGDGVTATLDNWCEDIRNRAVTV